MSEHDFILHPIEPTFDQDSRVLILGSFPSVKTRAAAFPYAHPQNRFWPLMSRLLDIEPPLLATDPVRARQELRNHGVALWDTIASCEIIGSSDSSIRNATPTDLGRIFETADIRMVFCNGGTSYKLYQNWQYKRYGYEAKLLPSTSPANASWSIDRLYESWRQILDYLG